MAIINTERKSLRGYGFKPVETFMCETHLGEVTGWRYTVGFGMNKRDECAACWCSRRMSETVKLRPIIPKQERKRNVFADTLDTDIA